jgi:CheY-like chemotaxis protein
MHGGRIEAHSDGEGRGSEFIIRLPLADRQLSVGGGTDLHRLHIHLSTRSRVLVVDDNEDAASSLAMLLSKLGNEVETANNGPAALAAIQSFKPSVVLLDLGMPGMSGYEVAQRARAMPEGKETVLVALTGWGQEDDRRRTREAGFNHHLVKPVEVGVLEVLLSEIQRNGAAARVGATPSAAKPGGIAI